MADNNVVLQTPQDGENLEEFLQRFTDAVLQQIISNQTLTYQLSDILQQSFGDLERLEDALENLLGIIQRMNNFERLEQSFESLLPVRLDLLKSLDEGKEKIETIYKACSFGRFLGASVDLGSTVLGLWLRESQSSYSNLAFDVARNFGLIAFASAASEQTFTKKIFNNLINKLQSDQALCAPIQNWYHQCIELEEAMTAVFPFQITNDLVNNFRTSGNAQFRSVNLLSSLLRAIGEQDITNLRNDRLIRNLINFTLMPASQDWCEWILFYRHPIMLDITRVLLQLQNKDFGSIMNQAIPALRAGEDGLQSVTMWVRMAVNCAVMYESINCLRSSRLPEVAHSVKQLKEHLASETAALRRIVEFVRSRKNNDGHSSD